ncbi:MAG: hypothetical protein LBE11_03825 [Prevotellaceae bacterium]|nr:hypothetical protein [Prevotellaceae bacterium]
MEVKKYVGLNALPHLIEKLKERNKILEWQLLSGMPRGNFSGKGNATVTVLMMYINGIICLSVNLGMFDSSPITTQPGVAISLGDLIECVIVITVTNLNWSIVGTATRISLQLQISTNKNMIKKKKNQQCLVRFLHTQRKELFTTF